MRERQRRSAMNDLHNFLALLPESELRAIQRTLEDKLSKDEGNFQLNAYYDAVINAIKLLKA